MKKLISLSLLILIFSQAAYALDKSAELIQFKAGEYATCDFLGMISEKLDIQIDASQLGPSRHDIFTVPKTGPLPRDRAEALVLNLLYVTGLTWIHDTSTDFYRILPQRDARDEEVPIFHSGDKLPDEDLMISFEQTVKYTSTEFIARTLRSFMPAAARIIPYDISHMILITDSARNIAKLSKLIDQLDNPEAAQEAREYLANRAKKADEPCGIQVASANNPPPLIMIFLFSLIALVIGFLSRGYLIRRIEGGL